MKYSKCMDDSEMYDCCKYDYDHMYESESCCMPPKESMPKMTCKPTKECVKTYKSCYKLYKICSYCWYKCCMYCGHEFDYHQHQGVCPKCRR